MYKIFDLHNDYFLKLVNDKKKDKYVDKQKFAENIITAIWTSETNEHESFYMLENAREFVNKKEKLFLGVEDLHFLNKDNVARFLSLRPIYAGLTWNTCNAIAGGAHESGRLSAFGKRVVRQLEDNNIIVDMAHLNEDSFNDVAKVINRPLFCSHTACFSVCENARNLKDYQIKMIIESGGLVGLCLVSEFINGTKQCQISDIVSQIDYFACKFGIDNLALGTDFYGTSFLPKGISDYKDLSQELSGALEKLGYTEKSINKIFFENADIFLKTQNI